MPYVYFLKQRSLAMLLGSFGLIAFLVFSIGLLVGLSVDRAGTSAEQTQGSESVPSAAAPPSKEALTVASANGKSASSNCECECEDDDPLEPTLVAAHLGEQTSPPEFDPPDPPSPLGAPSQGSALSYATKLSDLAPAKDPRPAVLADVILRRGSHVAATNPDPVREAEPATPNADPPSRRSFAVQVGVFGVRANAERLVSTLSNRNYPASAVPVGAAAGSRTLLAVRIGHFDDRQAALRAATELERHEGMQTFVVPN